PRDHACTGDPARPLRAAPAAGKPPFACRHGVESGRVLVSPLFPASFPAAQAPAASGDGLDLASPAPGEPVGRELVIAGSAAARQTPFSRRFVEVFIDATRIARLRARGSRGRLPGPTPPPSATGGPHTLRLRLEPGGGVRPTIEGPTQVAWLAPAAGDGAAVSRAAICVELRRRENVPAVKAGQAPWPV